jgi:hypothetical protein
MSVGVALNVRNSFAADCAAAPGQSPAIATPTTAASIKRLFVLGFIAIYAFVSPVKTVSAFSSAQLHRKPACRPRLPRPNPSQPRIAYFDRWLA